MDYKNADMYTLMCERDKCSAELEKYAKSGLSLDLSRGKPSAEQLALSLNMLDVLDHRSILDSESGQDCRNYGGLDGIEEAKRLLSHMMGTHSVNTIVGGNSSLTMIRACKPRHDRRNMWRETVAGNKKPQIFMPRPRV